MPGNPLVPRDGHAEVAPQTVDASYVIEPGEESPAGPSLFTAIVRRWYVVLIATVGACAIGLPLLWLLLKPEYTATAVNVTARPASKPIVGDRLDFTAAFPRQRCVHESTGQTALPTRSRTIVSSRLRSSRASRPRRTMTCSTIRLIR